MDGDKARHLKENMPRSHRERRAACSPGRGRQPALPTSKEGSGAPRNLQVKPTRPTHEARVSRAVAGSLSVHSPATHRPPQPHQAHGNTPSDVSCPHLQTPLAWDCHAEGTQVHMSREGCGPPPGVAETTDLVSWSRKNQGKDD